MTFSSKLISIQVQLAQGSNTSQPNTFAESGTDTTMLSGSRTQVRIENASAPGISIAHVKIWGLTPSLMNQLSALGIAFNQVPGNFITITAGDAVSGMSTVFSGVILNAYGDYQNQPDVPFLIEANSTLSQAVGVAQAPSSFPGTQSAANIMAGIAGQMGLTFENNSVTAQLSNVYLSGSLATQADRLADMANFKWGVFGKTLAIWPLNGSRNSSSIPTISPENGMIGYPAFAAFGIVVKTLFNPQLSYGSKVQVNSSVIAGIASASAGNPTRPTIPSQFTILKVDHSLDSLLPGGDWMTTIQGWTLGSSTSPPSPS
jgi:hypothetical protein